MTNAPVREIEAQCGGAPCHGCRRRLLPLLEPHQFDDGTRWLLGQYQRMPVHREFVLVPGASNGERALGHHGFRSQHVPAYAVRSGVEIKRIENGYFFGVGGFVIRGIVGQGLRAVDSSKAVMLGCEYVQAGLGIRNRRPIRVRNLGNLPGSRQWVLRAGGLAVDKYRKSKQAEDRDSYQSSHWISLLGDWLTYSDVNQVSLSTWAAVREVSSNLGTLTLPSPRGRG